MVYRTCDLSLRLGGELRSKRRSDAISIFFTIGDQDAGIILAINALLATTVGPYELVSELESSFAPCEYG
jgi:hypothetical protein